LNINESAFDEYRTITDKDNVDYFSSPLLFPDQLNDMADLMILSYPNGYNMSVFQLVCNMAIEFGSVEGIVAYAEAMMATRKPGDRGGAYPESLTERQVWS
jgi:hypothetical protein